MSLVLMIVVGVVGLVPRPAIPVAPNAVGVDHREIGRARLDEIARAIVAASPIADEGDSDARDAAGQKLAQCDPLLRACGETIRWGGFDPAKGYDPNVNATTEFAPLVWARLYLSTFMFPGEYSVRTEGRYEVIELPAKFRSGLEPGEFPYPFWHSPKKWQAYVEAHAVVLVFDEGELVAAYRKTDASPALPDRRWDGKWQWTNESGEVQPRVALFSYLLSEDNPYRAPLEESYRALESRVRSHGCVSCHAPDNPAQASPLVMLSYPNQSLGARHAIVETLRLNEMPPADAITGAAPGLADEKGRAELIRLAEEFAREGDAALAYERGEAMPAPPPASDAPPTSGQGSPPAPPPPAVAANAAPWKTLTDDWYTLTLAGVHAGWMRVVREDDGERYRTINEMTLRFERGGTSLSVDNYVEWTETHDGTPVRLLVAKKRAPKETNFDIGTTSVWERTREGDPLGLLSSRREWVFQGDKAIKTILDADKPVTLTGPIPEGPFLTPAAAQRFIATRIADAGRAIEYGVLDAGENLRYVSVRSAYVGEGQFAADGKTSPVTVWRTRTSAAPTQTVSHYTADGKLVYSAIDLGIGLLETQLTNQSDATRLDAVAVTPSAPATVIAPDRALSLDSKAMLEVRAKTGELPAIPAAGAQTATMSDDRRSATVTVELLKTSPATAPELVESRMRERTPVENSGSPVVLDLAAKSLQEADGLSNRDLANSSRALVHRHFAARNGALEAVPGAIALASSRGGTEEARLLCEVLRVHRIESRVASGLVYQPQADGTGAFAWGHWTQALIDGQWLDLDPSRASPFDVGHILLGFGRIGMFDDNADPSAFSDRLSDLEIKVISPE